MYRWIALAMCWLGPVAAAAADSLTLREGDQLSGALVDIIDGTLGFRTELAGMLIVPVDEVRALSTAGDFQIALDNGEVLRGRFASRGGEAYVVTSRGKLEIPIRLTDVVSAAPATVSPADSNLAETDRGGWAGILEGGWLWRSGTFESSEPFARLTLKHAGIETDFMARVLLEYADADAFPRLFHAWATWRKLGEGAWYPVVDAELTRDINQALDLRAELTAGAGRDIYTDERQRIALEAGLSGVYEAFDAEPVLRERFGGWAARLPELRDGARLLEFLSSTGWGGPAAGSLEQFKELAYYVHEERQYRNREIGARFRLEFARDVMAGISISQELALSPSLTHFGEFRAGSESALRVPITSALSFQLDLRIDYDSDPAFRALEKWQSRVGASITWDF